MQIPTKTLLNELEWVNRFVAKKTTIPILSNILFEVEGNRLTLTATDLEIGGATSVEGRGNGTGWNCAAPVAKLIKYLGKVDEPEVTIGALDSHWLTVKHGNDRTRIAGMSKYSYPELPAAPAPIATISRLPLAVQRVAFAISAEESRFTLNGVLLEANADGQAHLIATDGHRLSLAPIQVKAAQQFRALIPKKAILEAARMEDGCTLAVDENHLFLDWGQHKIIARKLTGNFPEWQRVMPLEMPSHVFVPVKTTLRTVDRVAVYADERSRAVRFQINGDLTVFASSVEEGESQGSVAYRLGEITGDVPFEIGLNASYVSDFLSRTDQQNVAFCWATAKNAAVLATSDGWRCAIMPMRI